MNCRQKLSRFVPTSIYALHHTAFGQRLNFVVPSIFSKLFPEEAFDVGWHDQGFAKFPSKGELKSRSIGSPAPTGEGRGGDRVL